MRYDRTPFTGSVVRLSCARHLCTRTMNIMIMHLTNYARYNVYGMFRTFEEIVDCTLNLWKTRIVDGWQESWHLFNGVWVCWAPWHNFQLLWYYMRLGILSQNVDQLMEGNKQAASSGSFSAIETLSTSPSCYINITGKYIGSHMQFLNNIPSPQLFQQNYMHFRYIWNTIILWSSLWQLFVDWYCIAIRILAIWIMASW